MGDDTVERAVAEVQAANDRVMYEHAQRVLETFLDWRHKVVVFTLTVVSALVAVSGWMYQHDLRRAVAGPLLLAGLQTVASMILDRRNAQIIEACYDHGPQLARRLSDIPSPFTWIPASRKRNRSVYALVLRLTYGLIALVLLTIGFIMLVAPESPPAPEPTDRAAIAGTGLLAK